MSKKDDKKNKDGSKWEPIKDVTATVQLDETKKRRKK